MRQVPEEEVREVYGGEEALKLTPCILHGKKPYIHTSTMTTLFGKKLEEKNWFKVRSAYCGEMCSVIQVPIRASIVREWNRRQRQLRKQLREERRLEAERNRSAWQTLKELVSGALHFTK